MTSKISGEVLEAYLNCPFKAQLKLAEHEGNTSDYERMLADLRGGVRCKARDRILSQQPRDQIEESTVLTSAALKRGPAFILDAVLEDDRHRFHFDGLKKVVGTSSLGPFHFIPMLFHESRHIRKEQKLFLAMHGVVLAELQGLQPEFGIVWHGLECRASKVRLTDNQRESERVLAALREIQDGVSKPPLILNNHCQMCEFRQRCHAQAMNEDNLSLMRGIGGKEIKAYARKGIFSVGQLSHTFRPRRKGKRAEPGSHKRHHSLQAMAIRDKTIYVLGQPELRTGPVQVYFDIESGPNEVFVYLIGMIVRDGAGERRYSFWADDPQDERAILEQFLAVMASLKDFVLFCYGSYELAFLKRMQKHEDLKIQIDIALAASVNILSVVYAHVYFPTYSNGLKEIGNRLGFTWTEPDASGLQSVVWRAKWESTHDDVWKQKLLQYNLEDCAALKLVADQVNSLVSGSDTNGGVSTPPVGSLRVATVREFDQQARIRKWGAVSFVHPDYAYINGCAYFSYQRQRVYVQTNKTLRKKLAKQKGYRSLRMKVTRRFEILASDCELCKSADVVPLDLPVRGRARIKRAFDLVGSANGIKLSTIECRTKVHQCRTCGEVFVPSRYLRLARYFHGVKSWAMYQQVAHSLSFGTIREMIEVFFDLPIRKAELHRFKIEMARYYEESYQYLLTKLLSGNLLHVDETQLRLKGGKTAYIWAFTNLQEVVYVFRPNREGEFLREFLKGFGGVLVSDFYAAYDSLACPQQKCLIHLIRDMNDDLLGSPFDEDLQAITKQFGALLRPIVSAIGEHGLRKRHLRPFKRSVEDFFQSLPALSLRSEVALALRNRLTKYRAKLFTFLDHDGVPWNNNNAENAIKRFALYRAHASGMMKESGVTDFLTLLSICQTCKYKGISFWKFLLSRQQFGEAFSERKLRRKPPPVEVYPEGFVTQWDKFAQSQQKGK